MDVVNQVATALSIVGANVIVGYLAHRHGYRQGRKDVLEQIEATKKAGKVPYSGLFDYPPEG